MLTVTRLKLVNICQYDSIDVPISTGLMAVCGRNGSGKSTLLRGLMYGLTGLVDGSWGTQQNLQKDGCAIPGYVVVTLHDDMTNSDLIIKRYAVSGAKFADSVQEFKDGQYKEVAVRRKTVDAYLGDMYGVSVSLLFQLCWGRQGQLDLLLTSPAAYVSTFLSSIFNTKYLDTLRDKLKLAIDQIAVMADPSAKIQSNNEEIATLEASLKSLEADMAPLEEKVEKLTRLQTQLQTADAEKALEDTKKIASLKAEYETYSGLLDELVGKMQFTGAQKILAKLDRPLDEQLQEAKGNEAVFKETIAGLNSQRAEITAAIQEAKNEQYDLATVRNRKKDIKRTMENLAWDEQDRCAMCGNKIPDKKAYIAAMCKALMIGEAVEDMMHIDEQIAEAEQSIAEYDAKLENLNKQLKETDVQISDFTDSLHSLQETIGEITFLIEDSEKEKTYREKAEAAKAELDKYAKTEISAAISSRIKEVIEQLKEATLLLTGLEKQHASLDSKIEVLKQMNEMLEKEQAQHDTNTSARRMLITLRDAFSQQRAQARYFASKTGELNQRLQSFMEITGMPFSLRLDTDTRVFTYTSEGGFTHPTAHLSGAQKNISAVALQMALVEVIRPNINLFLFDEPSESLDVENKIVMADLFRRMNRLLPSIGGTMLIVSRDEQLIESCENTININQGEENEPSQT